MVARIRARLVEVVLLLQLFLSFHGESHGLSFPEEVPQKVRKESFCAQPTVVPAEDQFEYLQYMRIPFDRAPHLDKPQAADPEGYKKHVDLLQKIYSHPLLLTRSQVQRGVVSPGDDRIQRFVTKLIKGEPVRVVVLGGSISFGHGVKNVQNSWPSRLFHYIETAFPNSKHQLLNHAIPATTSSFITPCAYTMVPEDVDLVVVEFTLNDSADEKTRRILSVAKKNTFLCENEMDSPARRSMERLIRQILSLPSKPAMMYVHAWAGNRVDMPYYDGVEDWYTTIMSYYNLPTLSFRNAVHDLVHRSKAIRERIWPDGVNFHPTCVGTKFMADMVIGYLMDQAAAAAWMQHAAHMKAALVKLEYPDMDHAELPAAIFKGNGGNFSTQCILDDKIQGHVVHNMGFNWVNEGLPSSPKWGFVSETPGSQLAIKVSLENITYNGEDLVIGVGLLLSYSKMGVAQIGCLGGCACMLKEYSTYIKQSGWSMTYWRFLEVKVLKGSKECTVGVINSAKTYSDAHKLKVTSLLVSGELASAQASNSWIEGGLIDAPHSPDHRTAHRSLIEVDLSAGFVGGSQRQPPQNASLPPLPLDDMFPAA